MTQVTTKRLKLLVLVHVLLSVAGVAEYRLHFNVSWLPLSTAISSLLFAQVILLAFWVAMGTTRLLWRCAGLVAGCAYLAIWPTIAMLWLPEGALKDENFIGFNYLIALAMYGAFAAVFVAIYLFVRWKFAELKLLEGHEPGSRRPRFSILHVLLLTTLICLALSLSRTAIETDLDTIQHILALYGLVICSLLLAVVAVPWAILEEGRVRWRLASVFISTTGMGLSVSYVFYSRAVLPQAWQWWWLFLGQALAIGLAPVVVLILTLYVVRRCGFRLVTKPTRSASSSPFSADPLHFEPAALRSRTND